MNIENIVGVIQENIAVVLKKEPCVIDSNTSFLKLGVTSIEALTIINRVRKKLHIYINPVAMFEYKTIIDLATYLYECMQEESECA